MTDLPPLLQTALVDRYRIERELGQGGMATVYLAEDLKHHRKVAVKVLRPELAAALGSDRFLREIETTANLRHPHILPLFDSGAAGQQGGEGSAFLYYVMPYVEGESLRDKLNREKQLPLETALKIASEVADALDYAHSRSTIHRDIKPENILLEGGHAVVADFGIARAISAAGGETLTQTGMAIGTPHYMSPEQAVGEKDLDGRSDQYALGCVLYEMLAGHPPYTGPTAQAIVARQLTDPVPPLRTVRSAIPVDVEHAINRALSRVPADRFVTTGQFAAALAAGQQAGVGVESMTRAQSPDFATRQTGTRPGSRRRWVVASMVVLLAVAAVVAWGLLRSGSTSQLDPDLVAITPFNVLHAELEPWHEGLVDVLSRSLDGAGALRTVSPSISLRHWSGRADAAAAAALGRRTGAGLVVYGDVVAEGEDSVRIRAAWLNLGRSGPPLEVEVRGTSTRMTELIDQLTRELLRTLGG
ncbi:MAG: serine/threonine-protein kinase, partial [Gemmatimonadota bacterium]